MAVGDVVELSIEGEAGSQRHVHTLHFRYLTVGASEGGLIAAYKAGPFPEYRALFSTLNQVAQTIVARQVCGSGPLRAPLLDSPATPAGTRTVAGQILPTFTAELLSFRTALAGRSRRGRAFIGGLWEADTDGNNMVTGAGTRYDLASAYANDMGAIFGAGGTNLDYRWVVFSRKLKAVPGSVCADTVADVASTVHPILLSTMRSRRPGSGS